MSATAFLLWVLLPLGAVHWALRRRRRALRFQLLLDLVLLAVCWPLLAGLDLNPVRLLEPSPPFGSWRWSERTQLEPTASDVVRQLHPWWDLERRRVLRDRVPWLAPEIGAGTPLVGNGQSGWLAPVMLPVWALGPEAGTDVMAVWKLEAAGLGAFLLLSALLRLSFTAAAVGGLAWGGAPFLVGWLLWPVGWNLAALPWIWWSAAGLTAGPFRRRTVRKVVLTGLLWGWFLGCGLNPETAVIVLGSGLAAALALHPGRWRRLLGAMAVALPVGLLLAWPAVVVIGASSKIRALAELHPNREPLPLAFDLAALRQTLNPAALGHPWPGTWQGPYPYPAGAAGIGGAALLLAVLGRPRRRHGRWVVAAGFLLAVGLLLAMRPPVLGTWLARIPPLDRMTLPRFLLLVPWSLSLLAALGTEGVLRGRVRRWAAGLPLVLLAVAGGWTGGWGAGSRLLALLAPLAAGGAAALALTSRRVVPALVALELGLLAVGVNPAADPADRLPEPAVLRRLEERAVPGERLVGLDGVLPANLAGRYGLEDLRCFGPVRPWPLARLHALLGAEDPVLPGPLHDAPPRLLGAWSVRWVLAPAGRELDGWRMVDRGDGVGVWKNPWWRAELRLAQRVVAAPSEGAGWELLGSEPLLLPDGVLLPAGGVFEVTGAGTLRVLRAAPERIEVEVAGDGPQLLVVARSWLPGWRALVDGRPAAVLRANLAGLGVAVPPGGHRVELVYSPWTVSGLR